MKNLFLLLLLIISCTGANAQNWKQVGFTGEIPEAAESDLHITDDGTPLVGFIDNGDQTPKLAIWENYYWEVLASPTSNACQDVEITSIGNLFYLGYYDQVQAKYVVQQWDGSSWMLFGDPGIFSYYGTSAELEAGANPGELWISYINDGQNGNIKKWNGTSWMPFASNIANTGAPELYGSDVASQGVKVYYLTNDWNGGSDEITLWNSAESAGPFSPYGGGFFDNQPQYIDLEANPGTEPVVAYTKSSPTNELYVARTNGSGFDYESPITYGDGFSEIDIALGGNDSVFALIMETGSGEASVFAESNGGWDLLGGGPVIMGFNGILDLGVFQTTNKPYVKNQEGGFPIVRVYNNLPDYTAGTSSLDMCEDASLTNIYTGLNFNDADHDSVWVHAYSQNTGLIQNANIVVTRTNVYSPSSPDNIFKIDVTPESGVSGSVIIDVLAIDGVDTTVYPVTVNIHPNPSFSMALDNVTCNGNNDGVFYFDGLPSGTDFDVTYTMGSTVGPTTYTSDGGGTIYLTGLSGGSYSNFIVTSQQGCSTTNAGPHFISEPTALSVGINSGGQFICDGQSTSLTAVPAGGTPTYSISWDQGISDGISFTPSVGTLTYTVTVTDANGCIENNTADVTVYALPATPTVSSNSPVCDGGDLDLTTALVGGVTYNWTGPNTFTSTSQNPTISGIGLSGGGTYSLTLTDGNGCVSNPGTDFVSILPIPGPISVVGTDPSACGTADGSLFISGLDAGMPFDITYNNGGIQGPFAHTSTGAGDITIGALSAGSYGDVTVTDGNGCAASSTGPYNLTDPSAPSISAGLDTTICEGEPITLIANNPDDALISWDNGAINNVTFEPTATTTYTVTASSSGCTSSDQVTVTVNPLPTVGIATTPSTCGNYDGSATATISNGTAPYDVYWSNGLSTNSISNLPAHLYYINVTDNNGCYVMEVATVSSSTIAASGVSTDNVCAGDENGNIDLTVSGTGPFTYIWSNGSTSEDISNLPSGQYEVRIKDANNCNASASFEINEPTAMNGAITSTNTTTCGGADGTISSSIIGGVSPFTYQWKDGLGVNIAGATANAYSTASTGAYQVEVTDANGCIFDLFGSVSENNGPVVTVDSLFGSTCADDGFINIDVNSSFAITSTTWSSGQTTEDITTVGTGIYSVTVVDANTCTGVLTVEVPPILPDMIPICIVTVDTTTNTNLIVWEKPITTGIDHFKIYRESSIAGMFQLVDTVNYASLSQYNDTIAYPALRSWRYQISVVDTCGVESLLSPIHKTMHVTFQDLGSGNYDIYWDEYEGFSYSDYSVWRYTTQAGWVLLNTVGLSTLSVSDTPPTVDGLDYMIEIQPPGTCTATKAQDYNSSRSNTTAAKELPDPILQIDNRNAIDLTIYPNPSNGVFNVIFDEFSNYTVEVFDMSGQKIFSNISATNSMIIDLSNKADGQYLLKIMSENAVVTAKLIVH
jgi:hypothetical protein